MSGAVPARYAGRCPRCHRVVKQGDLIAYVRAWKVFKDAVPGRNVCVCEACAKEVTQ